MKRWVSNLLIVVFAAIFLVSGWMLLEYFLESRQQQSEFDELASLVAQVQQEQTKPEEPAISLEDPTSEQTQTEPTPTEPVLVQVTDPETGETVEVLPEYAELYTRNNDIVGWMKIEGTKINYPVMQTPHSVDYYLKRNFQKEYSSAGCLYAREVCDVNTPSDNVTIYGHNMKNGSMFAGLFNYTSKSFWEEHPAIVFDTLTEHHTYQIMAVFRTTASEGLGFDYHLFVDAADTAEYEEFVSACKGLSLYDTGVTAEYGDKLITLSTCEYSRVNGRLVVVAKRIA